jgi:hypothetical protein
MTKLGTCLVLRRVWNPIDFQGLRSKVNVTGSNFYRSYLKFVLKLYFWFISKEITYTFVNKGNAKCGVSPRLKIKPCDLDVWPWILYCCVVSLGRKFVFGLSFCPVVLWGRKFVFGRPVLLSRDVMVEEVCFRPVLLSRVVMGGYFVFGLSCSVVSWGRHFVMGHCACYIAYIRMQLLIC